MNEHKQAINRNGEIEGSDELIEVNNPADVPDFESEEEEAEFWGTHSFGEGFFAPGDWLPESLLPPARARSILLP